MAAILAASSACSASASLRCTSGQSSSSSSRCAQIVHPAARRTVLCHARPTHQVEVLHEGRSIMLDVPQGETVLAYALDKGVDLPHDCKLGVCMTCPAKLISGKVDQAGCMLSDDVVAQGYVLMCMAQPTENCQITTCSEEELLTLQMGEI